MAGHISPKSTYYAVFAALMVGTAITVAVAFVNLGSFNFPVAIGSHYQGHAGDPVFHAREAYSSKPTKLLVGTAFFFLLVLLTLTMTDYLSRGLNLPWRRWRVRVRRAHAVCDRWGGGGSARGRTQFSRA